MALTDHDTVEGCARAAAACAAADIEFIPGTELTAEHDGHRSSHPGYFLDTQNQKLLTEIANSRPSGRTASAKWWRALNKLDMPLKAEAVFALANCRSPGRPHVARALVKAGFAAASTRRSSVF